MAKESQGLDFVIYTGVPKNAVHDPINYKVVRSRAMRSGHLSRHRKDAGRQREAANITDMRDMIKRFRIDTKAIAHGKDLEITSTDREAVDDAASFIIENTSITALNARPYDPFIRSLGPYAWELLDHYRYHFRNTSISIHPKRDWFCFSMAQPPAVMHSTLAYISLDRDLSKGTEVSALTMYHRTAAIQQIREMMNYSAADNLEALAGAVVNLVSGESLEGNWESARAHINGIQSIISRAGGIQAFSSNVALFTWMHWALITYSSTWRYDTKLHASFGLDTNETLVCDCTRQGSGTCVWLPIRANLSAIISPTLLEALHLLHSLPQTQPSDLLSPAEMQRNARKLYTLELKLNSMAGEQDPYQLLLHCAVHVYSTRALRNLPRGSVIVSKLEHKLTFWLNRIRNGTTLKQMSAEQLLLFLWAVLLGQRPHEDDSCVGCHLWSMYILWMLEKLRIPDYEMLINRLKHIAWVDGFEEVELRKLFD